MDHVLARVKGNARKRDFKLISDTKLFDTPLINLDTCTPYNPDHNLDEDSWFKIENFSQQEYCIDLLQADFDSKDFDDLTKDQFSKIAYLFSTQGDDFYFQKVTPGLFIKRKTVTFGETAEIEQSSNRLVINSIPDAIYYKGADALVFRNLATISSIFKGIDQLYKEATKDEVASFIGEAFIELSGEYDADSVSKPNRKRIGLAIKTLKAMPDDDQNNMLIYIDDYCKQTLKFDKGKRKFEISTDDELKLLLYGIEQRFYTTPFGHERRLANSVQAID